MLGHIQVLLWTLYGLIDLEKRIDKDEGVDRGHIYQHPSLFPYQV
jgi:hypothetical protein